MASSTLVKFFAENVDWDTSERQALRDQNKGWKILAIAGWSVAAVAIAVALPLTALHEFVPVVATVDKHTGQTEVHVGSYRVDMNDPANERMMMADLGRYIKAREGFTRGEAEANYRTVYYMSSEGIRGEWDNEYRPDRNPRSLLSTLTAQDQIKLENISVQFLPSDKDNIKVAQVRYDRIKRIGAQPATTQRFISTFTFTYDPSNVPKNVEGLIVNHNGFTAINYRKDKESEERQIVAAMSQDAMGRVR